MTPSIHATFRPSGGLATAFLRHDHDDGVVSRQRANLIAAVRARDTNRSAISDISAMPSNDCLNVLPSAKPNGLVSEQLLNAVGNMLSSSVGIQPCGRIG